MGLAMQPWEQSWKQIGPLGAGGQGETSLVEPASGGRSKAVLKLLRRNDLAKARGRMAQEVTNLKVIHNAGGKVPKVLDGNTDQFEDSSLPLYFVMEHISGRTLAKVVSEKGGLPFGASLNVALD